MGFILENSINKRIQLFEIKNSTLNKKDVNPISDSFIPKLPHTIMPRMLYTEEDLIPFIFESSNYQEKLELKIFEGNDKNNEKIENISESGLEKMKSVVLPKTINLQEEDVAPFYETITKLQTMLGLDNFDETEDVFVSRMPSGNIKIGYYKPGKCPIVALFNNNAMPKWVKFGNNYDKNSAEVFLFDDKGKVISKIAYTGVYKESWNNKLGDFVQISEGVKMDRCDYEVPKSCKIIADEYKKK